MIDDAPQNIIFIPESGEMPDVFADAINELAALVRIKPRVVPWSGGVNAGLAGVEKLLDREEIRRVVLVGAGRGAEVALEFAAAQPRRVDALVLDSPSVLMDKKKIQGVERALKIIPGFMFRNAKKADLLKQVDEAKDKDASHYSSIDTPALIISGSRASTPADQQLVQAMPNAQSSEIAGAGRLTYRTHAQAFAAEIGRFLNA